MLFVLACAVHCFPCCCSPSCCGLPAMTRTGLVWGRLHACPAGTPARRRDPALPCPACPPAQGRAIFADRLTSGDVALPNGETRHLRAIDPVYVFPGKPGRLCTADASCTWPCIGHVHRACSAVCPLIFHARVSWALHLVLPALPTRCAALLSMQAWPWVSPCRALPACVRTCSSMPPRRWRAGEGGRALGPIKASCAG